MAFGAAPQPGNRFELTDAAVVNLLGQANRQELLRRMTNEELAEQLMLSNAAVDPATRDLVDEVVGRLTRTESES